MITPQEDVARFHEMTGQTIGETPAIRDAELRARLILEEAFETVEGLLGAWEAADTIEAYFKEWHRGDPRRPGGVESLPDVADGIADLCYVALGTAVACGIDMAPIWDAVHAANMKKGTAKDASGKTVKPAGWTPPDVEGELKKQGWVP